MEVATVNEVLTPKAPKAEAKTKKPRAKKAKKVAADVEAE
jgi:hypothetical protein